MPTDPHSNEPASGSRQPPAGLAKPSVAASRRAAHAPRSPQFTLLLGRALARRCPVCGEGKLYRSWFSMHAECPRCGVRYEREPGFFLGSIYINYGLTALIVAIVYPVLLFGYGMPETPLLIGSLAFTLLFPLLLFPWARSLWLGFDQWRDPREGDVVRQGNDV